MGDQVSDIAQEEVSYQDQDYSGIACEGSTGVDQTLGDTTSDGMYHTLAEEEDQARKLVFFGKLIMNGQRLRAIESRRRVRTWRRTWGNPSQH